MKNKILLLLCFLPFFVFGQDTTDSITTEPDYIEEAFEKDHNQNKNEAYKYPKIHEKDIVWSRTIWRSIDLRQKINHHFHYPAIKKSSNLNPDKMSLIDVVMEAVQNQARFENKNPKMKGLCWQCKGEGELNSSSPQGVLSNNNNGAEAVCCPNCSGSGKNRLECFSIAFQDVPGNEFRYGTLTPQEILSVGQAIPDTTPFLVEDEFGNLVDSTDDNGLVVNKITEIDEWDRSKVKEWLVKEEWFFDKKRSVMEVRIVGLCPVSEDFYDNRTDQEFDRSELFWIYFPDFRDVLLNTKVATITKNNAQERSYLAIFEKRMFASKITMESNIMNREISDYMIGLDAILESERIQEEIFNIEHDLWEY